jgi:hypothetical protein
MPEVESLMRNRVETLHGWTKSNHPYACRSIKIGNVRNCNNDGLIKNFKIKANIVEVLNKYKINDYLLTEIDTEFEHSYDLKLKEEIYYSLKNKLTFIS